MDQATLYRLRFPIGEFTRPEQVSSTERARMIEVIRGFPLQLRRLSDSLKEELEWRYRPNGWTIRQVIHHCADSHLNAFARFKICLSEDKPTIRPYLEASWAGQADHQEDIELSLKILEGIHGRWAALLDSMGESDFQRVYLHPEHEGHFSLSQALANYDWHCRHHQAHIEQALAGNGNWN